MNHRIVSLVPNSTQMVSTKANTQTTLKSSAESKTVSDINKFRMPHASQENQAYQVNICISAEKEFKNGNIQEGLKILEDAIQLTGDYSKSLLISNYLIEQYYMSSNSDNAVSMANKAGNLIDHLSKISPNTPVLHFNWALFRIFNNDLDYSRIYLTNYINAKPFDPTGYLLLSMVESWHVVYEVTETASIDNNAEMVKLYLKNSPYPETQALFATFSKNPAVLSAKERLPLFSNREELLHVFFDDIVNQDLAKNGNNPTTLLQKYIQDNSALLVFTLLDTLHKQNKLTDPNQLGNLIRLKSTLGFKEGFADTISNQLNNQQLWNLIPELFAQYATIVPETAGDRVTLENMKSVLMSISEANNHKQKELLKSIFEINLRIAQSNNIGQNYKVKLTLENSKLIQSIRKIDSTDPEIFEMNRKNKQASVGNH